MYCARAYLLLPESLCFPICHWCVVSHLHSPFFVRWSMGIGASGPRLQVWTGSTQPTAMETRDQTQEHRLPWVPGQQPVDQPSRRSHDLTRHLDHGRTKRLELHPQQGAFLSLVLLGV